MKRKTFLYLFAVTAIDLPGLSGCRVDESLINNLKKTTFLSQILDEQTIHEIGKSYKVMVPSEKSNEDLAKLILTDRKNKSYVKHFSKTLNKEAIGSFIDEKIKDDMSNQMTMVVNGWVIALTEARQCALWAN
ncbi:MAG: hypothetical protein QM763_07465 [Agriterribacter sp.]